MRLSGEEAVSRRLRIGVLHLVARGATTERLDDDGESSSKREPTERLTSAGSHSTAHVCGALALVLQAPGPWFPWALAVGFGYIGIWLGGLLGLVAIGTGGATFIRDMRNRALDIPLAVFGLLAGIPCVLWALWILGLTIGGGMGE